MTKLTCAIDEKQIDEAVERIASEIQRDYKGTTVILLGVLRGSFIFLADLARKLDMSVKVDFIRVSSYGLATESTGKVDIEYGPSVPLEGTDVLVVEDIVDTGLTTGALMDYIARQNPNSLRLCALLNKPARRKIQVPIDYLGFTVPDLFLVGYGLDKGFEYRNLPYLFVLNDED